jgi:hypothetical protein
MEALLDAFGADAHLSLEGDLSKCNLDGIPVLSTEPRGVLVRNTLSPQQDFVIIPLNEATKDQIKQQVLPTVGIRNRVHHVMIESGGQLVFASYDWFEQDSVWVSNHATEALLDALVESGALRHYAIAPA